MNNRRNCHLKTRPLSVILLALAFGFRAPAQTNDPPAPKWESSAAAGLTLTRGNSQTLLTTVNLQTQRKSPFDEYLFGADGAYGTDNGVKNTESLHGFGQYNHLATGRWYYGLRLDGVHDAIADVDYRATLAPLAGYYFIKATNTTLAAEAGPALVYQKQGGATRGYAGLRLGERFEHKFSATAKMWQSFEIIPQVDKLKNYYINAEIGAEAALSPKLSLRSYVQDTYYNTPATGRKNNDVKLVTAVAYKF